jgi:hypothetical protein
VVIVEIRPFRNGRKCFEASGVEPVFLDQEQAIDYALTVHVFDPAKFGFWIQLARSHASFRLMKRVENCDSKLV